LDLITSSLLGNVTTECFFLDCYGRIFDWNSINSLLFINKKKRVNVTRTNFKFSNGPV
jgi:hypothetical protein